MYLQPAFRQDNVDALHALMRGRPLATLVVAGGTGIEANHLPLLLDDGGAAKARLSGHISKRSPLANALQEAPDGLAALAIFHGPEHYISPGWYPSKATEGKAVPTWNYAVVHAHGVLRPMQDETSLRAHLEALTAAHEAGRTPPWSLADAPADFIAELIAGVAGFDIEISRLEGKFKLGQNRGAEDRAGIHRGLEGEGRAGAAELAAMTPK